MVKKRLREGKESSHCPELAPRGARTLPQVSAAKKFLTLENCVPFIGKGATSDNSRPVQLKSYSRSRSPYSRSPVSMRDRSYSPYDWPDDRSYRRNRYRSVSRSASPNDRYYGRHRYRFVSHSASPRPRRRSRRSYSRSATPISKRRDSPSVSPRPRRSPSRSSKRSVKYSKQQSRSSSVVASSRSVCKSNTPRSSSPST
ncbi:pre-mRNA-splicing factor CWC22-like [Vigna radiata var. radiata]|uniref:Pre-mRNA-splicing factor CWC22-like n=1 Tax=Vigna radiata var. radiata TaxID=3916 RepID=A0A1S3UKZ3_VIGRR|nr:pre-mRNA-splicing factor CWC22-like [Vigna radiata var. radiata]